jgi:hypothetical protein
MRIMQQPDFKNLSGKLDFTKIESRKAKQKE